MKEAVDQPAFRVMNAPLLEVFMQVITCLKWSEDICSGKRVRLEDLQNPIQPWDSIIHLPVPCWQINYCGI